MGLENSLEKNNTDSLENIFGELTKNEQEVKAKIKAIFQENAELNGLLVSDELDMTDHQKIYYGGKLKGFRVEAKDDLSELRASEEKYVPKELQGFKKADNYKEKMAA